MILWLLGISLFFLPSLIVGLTLTCFHFHVLHKYVPILFENCQTKPLFVIPRGTPWPGAEDVTFTSNDGSPLRGCYVRTQALGRRGVILFGLEYGSDRWSCRTYIEGLVLAGYDVFAFEPRGQGQSAPISGYEPLQWVAEYEVDDTRAAIAYLKARPDADPAGIGFFGISKGAGAGMVASVDDPYVRCFVTDGMFGFETTAKPFMRKWFSIYNTYYPLETVPDWYLIHVCRAAIERIEQARNCRFVSVEKAVSQIGSRALLMIHGESDLYIKPSASKALYDRATGPRELWMVPGAKHNQALHVAESEYRRRVLAFFDRYLAELPDQAITAAAESCPTSASDAGRTEAVTSGLARTQ
ncbi:MAG: hypothetical protein EBV06_06160 [Planctomycetia bacterium]|nr:hypothetical protein [Planctomycetia bacterium]